MPVVSVVLAGLMKRSRGAIRLGMRIACRRTPTAIGFRGYSLWIPDSRECGYSVRIQCVRLHDRAIRSRGSPGSDKLESVCTWPEVFIKILKISQLVNVNGAGIVLFKPIEIKSVFKA